MSKIYGLVKDALTLCCTTTDITMLENLSSHQIGDVEECHGFF